MKVFGVNPIIETIKAGSRTIDKIVIAKGRSYSDIEPIIQSARRLGIQLFFEPKEVLDKLAGGANHQGIIAFTETFKYSRLDDALSLAERKGEKVFILILDHIVDPHNLGALIRTAHCAGAHGVVIPDARAASVNETVSKTSAGAVEHIPIIRVSNINNAIRELRDRKIWIIGADSLGERSLYEGDYRLDLALVVGNEGEGLRKLVKENCDFLISIPMKGKIDSLNASVSGAVIMYEILRQRSLPSVR